MDPNDIKDWLIPIASFVGIISTSVGVWLALKEYRLKLKAEQRLAESTRAETDIRLFTHFTDILEVATGRRRDPVYSKEVAEKLLEKLNVEPANANFDYRTLRENIATAALLHSWVGNSSSDAAFASITTLALRHKALIPSAIQALESFNDWKPELAKKYLTLLKNARPAADNLETD
ncbi:hypothetical protein [Nitrosomonas sp.]|uniref:hypothetical protein n=1 Tax=Nitrosomonas sp. TaxID=42353 RepID=UPI001E064F5A|nr:hypothetical protein [Nitrosomonas sp.]MCB1948305.1 hypothetical protein [Nitrosomonas sp.]MCP5291669.1 hypothetical protein [Burkholderiales bacterium]MDR4514444.1 hypothetical protein [Nitrosomonas sp.]